MNIRPLILLTNDDGIDSPGIAASARALGHLGDLLIVAPHTQQTSLSRAFPKVPDLGRIEEKMLQISGKSVPAYSVVGSPAYCVSHAVLELAGNRKISLCVSGVNYGENIGLSIMPSGTIGAAFEADTYDIPAIAASLEVAPEEQHRNEFDEKNWEAAEFFLQQLASNVLRWGRLPDVGVWNLNVPADASLETPCRFTRQSRQNYFIFRKPAPRCLSEPKKLSVGVEYDAATLEPDGDIRCVIVERCVSITPLAWDMTAHRALAALPAMMSGHEKPPTP